MSSAEPQVATPEASQHLHDRWVNDIAGAIGSFALFGVAVGTEARVGVSSLCLIAGANFVGGAFDKARQLAACRQLEEKNLSDNTLA